MLGRIYRFFLSGMALWAILFMGVSPGAAQSPDTGKTSRNVLRYALHSSKLASLDPDFAKGSQNHTYADMVFNSLWRYTPGDSRQMEPDLALEMPRFEMVHGRQVWTVYLRHNVFFHESPYYPAHELTAEDVVFSLKKAGDRNRSAYSGVFRGMAFEIVDSHTLKIIMDKSVSPLFFLPKLANWRGGCILSKKAIEKGGYENFLKHPVGTGPFQFVSYVDGEKLVLKANPVYFRGRPRLEGVEVHFMPDNKAREAAFRAGQFDVIYGVGTPGWVEKLEKAPGAKVDVYGPGYTGTFHFNTSAAPMDDLRVRKALMAAMDRNGFMAASSPRLVTPVLAPMSSFFLPGGLTNEKIRELKIGPVHDPQAAIRLLAQAGYPHGFDLNLAVSEKRLYRTNYEVLKSQLARVNVRVNLNVVPHSQYHKMIRENLNPIVLYFTIRPNADNYLRRFFHSDTIVKTGKTPGTNFSHYRGIDRLLDHALSTIDPRRQVMLWEQAQIKLLYDRVVYPLFDINQCSVRRNYVDYAHPLHSSMADYPQFTEKTRMLRP